MAIAYVCEIIIMIIMKYRDMVTKKMINDE